MKRVYVIAPSIQFGRRWAVSCEWHPTGWLEKFAPIPPSEHIGFFESVEQAEEFINWLKQPRKIIEA